MHRRLSLVEPEEKPLGVAIVGCGLIGNKRAASLPGGKLIACADTVEKKAVELASRYGALPFPCPKKAINADGVDVVIVATTNDQLTPVSLAAISAGKHVLVEKPAARSSLEAAILGSAAHKASVYLRVGFNHRYHPAIRNALQMVGDNEIGELMFLRGRYGHGGRVGYDREWRADPELSGGGELIDQGIHLIDLSRKILGDFSQVDGFARTFFWDMPVDDNAFLLLQNNAGQVADLHVSCSEWKNLFSLEIYGRTGKLHVEGLGGSYGTEKLTHYRMRFPEMGPPDTVSWEFPRGDDSWSVEFSEFAKDIRESRKPCHSIVDAIAALEIVEKIYKQSKMQKNGHSKSRVG